MARLLLLLIALLLATVLLGPTAPPARLALAPESHLWIEGTSSLHDWRCEAPGLAGWIEVEARDGLAVPAADVAVPAAGLDCKNGTMNRKARAALAADDYPAIRFALDRAEVLPGTGGAFDVAATGRLTVAGTTRAQRFTAAGQALPDGRFRFTGAVALRMTTFGIDPPTALLGTLKTGDEIVVGFEVIAAPDAGAR